MPAQNESNMIQELREIPRILISENESHTVLLQDIAVKVQGKIPVICGMGSSYFLAEFGVFFLKHIAGVPNAYCSEADELMNQVPDLGSNHALFGLSQSGSSKETVSAIEKALDRQAFTCVFHNKAGSPCEKIPQLSLFQNIGTEKSPVSTKYITFQLVLLYKLAIFLSKIEGNMNELKEKELIHGVAILANAISHIFEEYEAKIRHLAQSFKGNKFVVVGNGINTYSAQEIALKIRETTGLDATHDTEGLLKHGGINSVGPGACCILLNSSEEIRHSLQTKACEVITFGNEGHHDVVIPHINRYLDSGIIMVVGQLFVHHLSCHLNIDTDIKDW